MSVLDYCVEAQEVVEKNEPPRESPLFMDWFADTGRASSAVGFALDGKNEKALEIAEKLYAKYAGIMDEELEEYDA